MPTANNPHASTIQSLLILLQALGTFTLDALRYVLRPGGVLRRMPLLRVAVVASLVVAIFQSDLHLSITLGGDAATVQTAHESPTEQPAKTLLAGFFTTAPNTNVSAAPTYSDREALAVIERFEQVALAEQERFGIPAEVLLAAAVVSSGDQLAQRSNNFFGQALDGPFASPWESWRAMSLSILAEPGARTAATQAHWCAVVGRLYPNAEQVAASIAFAAERYDL